MRLQTTSAILLAALIAIAGTSAGLCAGAAETVSSVRVTHDGVTAWIAKATFDGDLRSFDRGDWQTLPADKPADSLTGYPVLATKTAVVALASDGSKLTFSTRRENRLTQRGELAIRGVRGPARFKLMADDHQHGLAVEVSSADRQLCYTIVLSREGILEIKQPAGQKVVVRSRMQHALVPSLVGTDLLYSPDELAGSGPIYVPSMNMLVGLLAGNDGVMVGVWPPGEQFASIHRDPSSNPPTIDAFSLETVGQSFYLAFIEHTNIWHEELLRDAYLEKDTAIDWRRPFEARWIGRFFIESEDYDFPFYFLSERRKLWGRCIRGWYYYPVWFDGLRTMVHFEKKFPPKGRLLIYYLDTYRDHVDVPDILSPVEIMQRMLGQDQAAKLLDFEGTKEQVLLEHRNAVCAMTRKIESYFAKADDAPQRPQVEAFADDVATFIRLIRERAFQYERFASEMQTFLKTQKQAQPSLAAAVEPIDELLTEIREAARDDLPSTSLDEVRAWTNEIKTLTADVGEDTLVRVKALTQKCRSVAGTQDDLARDLSILTIRLTEQAARMGTWSPQHVRLAEQILVRSRAILRQPTWWEPCRKYMPKSNPGAP